MIFRKEELRVPSSDGLFDGHNATSSIGDTINTPAISRGRAGIVNSSVGPTRNQVVDYLINERGVLYSGLLDRIQVADGQGALFLPFLGEVGWRMMWHTKLVHLSKASQKWVCLKRGQECLYPSADGFMYDWEDPYLDADREGTDRFLRMWPQLESGLCEVFVQAGGLSLQEEEVAALLLRCSDLKIKPKQRDLFVDVCLATRRRSVAARNNYAHWQAVADAILDMGLTFAIIGDRNTSSFPLEGMQYMSGDFDDFDAAVELLQNCKLFVGTDSGGAHLAALAKGCPMIVQETSSRYRVFTDSMRVTTPYRVQTVPYSEWNNPQAIIAEIAKEFGL